MSILGVHSNQGICNPYFAQDESRHCASSPVDRTAKFDTVRISAQAKELAQNGDQNLPLEAFSLPGWYVDMSSDLVELDSQVGIKYSESNRARYDALSSSDKRDLAEYQDTLHKYFQEGLWQQGIESPSDYYKNIVQNQEASEELHQVVRQSIASDSRAMELMDLFNITL